MVLEHKPAQPPNFFELSAGDTARMIIDDPANLPLFIKQAADASFLADAPDAGQVVKPRSKLDVEVYVGQVNREVDLYDWSRKKGIELSPLQARSILECLPAVGELEEGELSPSQQLMFNVVGGYISRRFEPVTEKPNEIIEWEQALFSLRGLLESTVEPEMNLELAKTWLDLVNGRYYRIMHVGSVTSSARFLGRQSVDLAHTKALSVGIELDNCINDLSDILGVPPSAIASHEEFILKAQFEAAMAAWKKGFNPGLSENEAEFRKLYDAALNRVGFKEQDIAKYRNYYPMPVLFQVAAQVKDYPNKWKRLTAVVEQMDQQMANEGHVSVIPKKTSNGEYVFPFKELMARYPISEKLVPLLVGYRKKLLYDLAQKYMVQKQAVGSGKAYLVVPFIVDGLQGYAVIPGDESMTDAVRLATVTKAIRQYHVKATWLEGRQSLSPSFFFQTVPTEGDIDFFLSSQEYVDVDPLDNYLKQRLPDEILRQTADLLGQNLRFKMQLEKQSVTRLPFKSGDEYVLGTHPGNPGFSAEPPLPGVIDKVRLKPLTAGSGLEFKIDFTGGAEQEPPLVPATGKITFKSVGADRTYIDLGFDPPLSQMNIAYRVIFENMILHLLQSSCYPTLTQIENELEVLNAEKDALGHAFPHPPHATHIGMRGERQGLPTDRAQANYQKFMAEYLGATGCSLATLNAQHHLEHTKAGTPEERFLTWNVGIGQEDITDAAPAMQRVAPEVLLTAA